RAATALHKALAGARVRDFRSDVPLLLRELDARPLAGKRIEKVEARGKHLLIRFEDGRSLRTHLRMRGAWHLYRSGEAWQRSEWADEQLARLIAGSHRLLVANRESGPRTSRNALTGPRVWVYGRSGKPCLRCGTIIRMRRQGTMGRSTYYCPSCQG